jgi:hypothetical protein
MNMLGVPKYTVNNHRGPGQAWKGDQRGYGRAWRVALVSAA